MRRQSGMWMGLLLGLGVLAARTAGAQDDKKNDPAADNPDNPMNGPSLRETGRIGATSSKTEGFPIDESRRVTTVPSETAVTPVAEANGIAMSEADATPSGHIDPARLEPEVEARFANARLCRIEVARHKRIAIDQVRAKTLELRWTILPSGLVAATQVVATSPADADVMSCVKARMASWKFTAPTGGAVAMDRSLAFH